MISNLMARKLLKKIFEPKCVACLESGVVLDELVDPYTWDYCPWCDLGEQYKKKDDAANSREETVTFEDGSRYVYAPLTSPT